MIKKTLFFCFSIMVLGLVNGQNAEIKFFDGKVVKGDMDYNSWQKNTNEIIIKTDGKKLEYKKSEIKEFVINSEKYIRKTVDLNVNQQNLQSLDGKLELKSEKKEIFLRVIVLGEVSLYSFRDSRTHFFISKAGKLIELIYLKRKNRPPLKNYVGQLNITFSDCENTPSVEKIKFDEKSIKKAVSDYNKCVSGDNEYLFENNNKVVASLVVIGGVKSTSINFSSSDFIGNFEATSGSNFSASFGIGLDLGLLPKYKKWEFSNELLFQEYKFDAFFRDDVSTIQSIEYFLLADLQYLELNNFLRFYLGSSLDSFNFFLSTGLTHSFLLSDDSTEFANSIFLDDITTSETGFFTGSIKSYVFSGSLGFGVKYKSIKTELRYSFNTSFTERPSDVNFSNISLLLAVKVL